MKRTPSKVDSSSRLRLEFYSNTFQDMDLVALLSLSSEELEVVFTPRPLMSVPISLERSLTAFKKTLP